MSVGQSYFLFSTKRRAAEQDSVCRKEKNEKRFSFSKTTAKNYTNSITGDF